MIIFKWRSLHWILCEGSLLLGCRPTLCSLRLVFLVFLLSAGVAVGSFLPPHSIKNVFIFLPSRSSILLFTFDGWKFSSRALSGGIKSWTIGRHRPEARLLSTRHIECSLKSFLSFPLHQGKMIQTVSCWKHLSSLKLYHIEFKRDMKRLLSFYDLFTLNELTGPCDWCCHDGGFASSRPSVHD